MLICTKCHIEYEEGKKFCRNCGSPLTFKEAPTPKIKDKEPIKEEIAEGLLICPECNISYEAGKYCRRCGSLLVKQAIHQEKIEERVEVKEPKPKKSLICPKCAAIYEAGKFCKKCGSSLVTQVPFQEVGEPEIGYTAEIKPEPSLIQAAEKKPIEKMTEETKIESLPEERRKIISPLTIGIAGIVVLIATVGYLLWPTYSYLIKSPASSPPPRTSPPPGKPSKPSNIEGQEIEKIKSVLENIKQANLQKNIDLFMSCYSIEFKDREGRKTATLETWQNYDYLDLSYDLKQRTITSDTANARVEWLTKISLKGGGQPQENKAVLDVTFIKETDGWKIKGIKPVS